MTVSIWMWDRRQALDAQDKLALSYQPCTQLLMQVSNLRFGAHRAVLEMYPVPVAVIEADRKEPAVLNHGFRRPLVVAHTCAQQACGPLANRGQHEPGCTHMVRDRFGFGVRCNPANMQLRGSEVVDEIGARNRHVVAVLIELRPTVFPSDPGDEGFTSKDVKPRGKAAGPGSQVNGSPLTRWRLHEVCMTGILHRKTKAPVRKDRVPRARLERSPRVRRSRGRDDVPTFGTPFCQKQVPVFTYVVEVRPFRPVKAASLPDGVWGPYELPSSGIEPGLEEAVLGTGVECSP